MCDCSNRSLLVAGALIATAMLASAGMGRLSGQPPKDSPKPSPSAPKDAVKPGAGKPVEGSPDKNKQESRYVLNFMMKSIEGQDVSLEDYKGKVILMVNVASLCGYTIQYEGLEKLYKQYKDKGLVILGFPANNFGSQEPGDNKEIATFCTSKYGVTFPMFAKISVTGEDQHPLYQKLASQPAPIGGDPKWNFTKFLVDRQGNVIGRYESKVKPDDKDLIAAIEAQLGSKN